MLFLHKLYIQKIIIISKKKNNGAHICVRTHTPKLKGWSHHTTTRIYIQKQSQRTQNRKTKNLVACGGDRHIHTRKIWHTQKNFI